MNTSESARSLPRRMIVSLQMGGGFFALANVVCVSILASTYLSVKHEPKTLEVKGSAKRAIMSDTIAWTGTITARDPDLTKAYDKIKADADRIADFIRQAGIPDNQVTLSAIATQKIYQREVIPTPPQPGSDSSKPAAPTVIQTNKIEMYVLTQCISIESRDMAKVPAVSRSITSLIKDGVEIESSAPRYL